MAKKPMRPRYAVILLLGPAICTDARAAAPPVARGWQFSPLRRASIPVVKKKEWVRNPIDAFVLGKLEARGLTPSARAGRLRLLRRVTFDLTGLPPTLVEQQTFLADRSANAYEKVVDRLLAS